MFDEAFPSELKLDLQIVLEILPHFNYSYDMIEYQYHHQMIKIPYRIYIDDIETSKIAQLSPVQKEILYCIYTRSSNGYIREKYINELLQLDFDKWVIPFIIKVCDEYVIEILALVYEKLKDRNNDDLKAFCLENKVAICRSYSRMISYWNEFYRNQIYHFHQYIGRKLFRECFGYDRAFEK